MKNLVVKTISISVLSSTFLLAATPNIGDIEKEVKVPKVEKESSSIPSIPIKEYKPAMIENDKPIFIKDFKLVGNKHINNSRFEKLFSKFRGKKLTFNQIQNITNSITKFYRESGYFVARAYIPVQDMTNNNILEISVIEGNYGKFKLNNSSLVKDSTVEAMLNDAKQRDNVISTGTLERAMLIINDTSGISVSNIDIMPGDKVGTSNFEITTQATNRFDGYIVADNYGSRYTGKNRLMAQANINSPFEIGDKISLFGLVSNDSNLDNEKLSYEVPLASNGLKGTVAYSQTNYSLGDSYKNLDATGRSKTIEGKLSYPIIKARNENLDIYSSLISKDLKDEVKSTNSLTQKDSESIKLGLDYSKEYLIFKSLVNTYFTYGKLNFDNATDEDTDKAGANTTGNYSKINIDLEHNINFNSKISLENSLKMQYALANKNLDGSEDFSIGGSNGVKLYPDGELSAENGYIFSTELKYQLPKLDSLNSSVGLFYDRGRAFMANSSNVDFESKSLQDIGLGLYNSYDKFFSKVQVAWNVNSKDTTSEPNNNSRLLFQGGLIF